MAFDSMRDVSHHPRNLLSAEDGFVPNCTKFESIPMLRQSEGYRMDKTDMYLMRGLLSGELSGYTRFQGKLNLGDALATARGSAKVYRRLAPFEGWMQPEKGESLQPEVMNGLSVLSSPEKSLSPQQEAMYKSMRDAVRKTGGNSFMECQDSECESLWVMLAARGYCKSAEDRAYIESCVPETCAGVMRQADVLNDPFIPESRMSHERLRLWSECVRLTNDDKMACEVAFQDLRKLNPGVNKNNGSYTWFGVANDNTKKLSPDFMRTYARASASTQAQVIGMKTYGADLEFPLGCIRFKHKDCDGLPYQTELQFHDAEMLEARAKYEFSKALKNDTVDRIDLVLPKTMDADTIVPSEEDRYYAEMQRNRYRKANPGQGRPSQRRTSDLNAAAAGIDGVTGRSNEGMGA